MIFVLGGVIDSYATYNLTSNDEVEISVGRNSTVPSTALVNTTTDFQCLFGRILNVDIPSPSKISVYLCINFHEHF